MRNFAQMGLKALKVGAKVRFLDEVGQGVVTQVISDTSVMVEDENGFEYPYESGRCFLPVSTVPPSRHRVLREVLGTLETRGQSSYSPALNKRESQGLFESHPATNSNRRLADPRGSP